MIIYDKLWQTAKNKGITKYRMYTYYNISKSQIFRLSHNQPVSINTIDRLCNMLECNVEDIMEHIPDDNKF